MSPAAAIAAVVAAAGTLASAAAIVLTQAPAQLAVPVLILLPIPVALAAFFAARRAIAASLSPMAEALEEQRKVARVHAAVARLTGAAVARLAQGDYAARITVELPLPYRPLRDDFNSAMEMLESAFAGLDRQSGQLRGTAREIGEAAAELSRRAGRLAERVDADLNTVEAGEQEPEAALRRVLHTMVGVRVAAQRNRAAADRFAELAQCVTREAERLDAFAGVTGNPADKPEDAVDADTPRLRLPAATVPLSIGSAALKIED